MSNRERKRAELAKRKARSAESEDPFAAVQGENGAAAEPEVEEESFQERMAKRSEARNAEVRATLEPLEEGERPGAVTVGMIVAGILALVFTVSAVVALVGSVEIDGEEPTPVPLFLIAVALWLMTWGLSKARYWAVLGLQMLLLLVILSSALGLVQVVSVPQVIATFALLAGSGTLFYFTIRAMARIQMPESPGQRASRLERTGEERNR